MKTFLKSAICAAGMMVSFGVATGQGNQGDRITMLVTLNVKPEHRDVFKKVILADKKGSVKDKGFITMDIYEHKDKPGVFYLFERWESKKALDDHLAKKHTQDLFELNKTALVSPMDVMILLDLAPLPVDELKQPAKGDTQVDMFVLFEVKDGMQDPFIQQFQKSITKSRPEPGNIGMFLHSVTGNNTKFVLYERWKNKAALDAHFAQPYTQELFESWKSSLVGPVEQYLNFVTPVQ